MRVGVMAVSSGVAVLTVENAVLVRRTQRALVAADDRQSGARSTLPVRIAITRGTALTIDVIIENLSANDLDLPVSASFLLGPEGREFYWAPINPMTGAPYDGAARVSPGNPIPPPPKPARIVLATGKSRHLVIDLRELKWDRMISSRWPALSLDTAVPPGRYRLVLELSSDASDARVRSNEVTVDVVRR
jgi:hypothetical protein